MAAAAVRHAAAAAPYMVVSARRWLGQEFDIKKGVHMIEYVACIPDSYDELTLDEEDISLGDGISQLAWCSFTELSTKLSEPMFGPLKRYLETNLKP